VILEHENSLAEGQKLTVDGAPATIAAFAYYVDSLREWCAPNGLIRFLVEQTHEMRASQRRMVDGDNPVEVLRFLLVREGYDVDHASLDAAAAVVGAPVYTENRGG
jgi:hypothetical protein